jgi:uncharacterized protein YndB with AHSA1/START domain
MTTGTPTALHLERSFAATPERVFDAWTNPAVLRRWWAAQPQQQTTVADVDLRVGGRYRLAMSGPEGEFTVSGRFEAIEPPDRLVYTWAWEGMPPMDTLVTVEFRAEGDGTRVVLTHTGLPGDDSRGQHEHGWHAVLDSLERALVSAA